MKMIQTWERFAWKRFITILSKYENSGWINSTLIKKGIFLGAHSNVGNPKILLDMLLTAEKKYVGERSFFEEIVNEFMNKNLNEAILSDPLIINFLNSLEKIGYLYSIDSYEWSLWKEESVNRANPLKVSIIKDEMEESQDEEGGDDLSHIPESEREVSIQPAQHSIFELHRKYERGDLIIQPFYQRKDVWKKPKKTKLIESVLRKIPIPSLYFAERNDGKWEVVDGQQRLRAFFDFLDDEYQLSQMPVLQNLKGNKFSSLSSIYQRKIEDYQLHVFLIKKDSHPDIRFDIFERINEGATPLNAQELRNSMYRDGEIEFIKRLSKNKIFISLTKGKVQTTRLKDQEAVLRFLAFYINGYKSYNGNLNSFLNLTLDNFGAYKSELENIEKDFDDTMKLIFDTLGVDAFVKDGSKVIHMSLFDVLSCIFSTYQNELRNQNLDELKKRISKLINCNNDFKKSISSNTLTKKNVRVRFDLLEKEVREFLREENISDRRL